MGKNSFNNTGLQQRWATISSAGTHGIKSIPPNPLQYKMLKLACMDRGRRGSGGRAGAGHQGMSSALPERAKNI